MLLKEAKKILLRNGYLLESTSKQCVTEIIAKIKKYGYAIEGDDSKYDRYDKDYWGWKIVNPKGTTVGIITKDNDGEYSIKFYTEGNSELKFRSDKNNVEEVTNAWAQKMRANETLFKPGHRNTADRINDQDIEEE